MNAEVIFIKARKILLSLSGILLSFLLMFSVFSSSVLGESEFADVNISGVNGSLKEFGENFFSIFSVGSEKQNSSEKISDTDNYEETLVYLGGYPVGLKLYADGVVIVGTESVDTANGNVNTADRAGLKVGDIIKKVNNETVSTNNQVSEIIENSGGENISFYVERDGKSFEVTFKSEFSVSENKYKAGLWIRDSSAGIGTVTFCTQDGYFAALGHAVCDIDTKTALPISQGECTDAEITGCIKGSNGSAGELCGYLDRDSTGYIYSNEDIGVYGEFFSVKENYPLYPIAKSSEVKTGEAEIYTTLDNGAIEKYTVAIEKIDADSKENKNLIIKVTDNGLIEKTGGIIQGMSGSPIIQNGKIIGAVTHVFLNEPTGGYGIFAETMYNNLEIIAESEKSVASKN